MRILRVRKKSGCLLEVVVFSNGYVAACWQTGVPEVAVYQSLEQFLKVRTKERGYEILSDTEVMSPAMYEEHIYTTKTTT